MMVNVLCIECIKNDGMYGKWVPLYVGHRLRVPAMRVEQLKQTGTTVIVAAGQQNEVHAVMSVADALGMVCPSVGSAHLEI